MILVDWILRVDACLPDISDTLISDWTWTSRHLPHSVEFKLPALVLPLTGADFGSPQIGRIFKACLAQPVTLDL